MLRNTFIIFFVFIFIFSLKGFAISIDLGLKGGINLAQFYGDGVNKIEEVDDHSDMTFIIGGYGGLGFGIQIIDKFAIQPEVLFSMKGSKYGNRICSATAPTIGNSSSEMKCSDYILVLNYLEIPILFKLIIPAGAVSPNIYSGPALGILLSAKGKVEDSNKNDDLKNNVEPIDFGLAMGGGIDIKAGPGKIVIDIRYNLGLIPNKDPFDMGFDDVGWDVNFKNSTLSLIAGYSFIF
jgi:hypothetical protein